MRNTSNKPASRKDWVIPVIVIVVAAALAGFATVFRNDSDSKSQGTNKVSVVATTTPAIPQIVRMLPPGTYFSQGAHKLCYPETAENRTQGHVNCSHYNIENNDLVTVLGDPVLGSDNAWYWPIQVLQGSFWAEFGSGDTRATWWLKDGYTLLEPIANASLIPPEPTVLADTVYIMNWPYFVRNGPAGSVITTTNGGFVHKLSVDGGSTHVTFTGNKQIGTSSTTGTRWWCQVKTLGDEPIENFLDTLNDKEREVGAWVPCEVTRASK